jgi:hypothetical protein
MVGKPQKEIIEQKKRNITLKKGKKNNRRTWTNLLNLVWPLKLTTREILEPVKIKKLNSQSI